MITERYRKDYTGEFVIVSSTWSNHHKEQQREWIPNPITNQHISGRAAVIGWGDSTKPFGVSRLEKHRGGLLGKKRLQTYGSGQAYQDLNLDFHVTLDSSIVEKVLDSGYVDNQIVYTNVSHCLRHPQKFYLIPYSMSLREQALAMWLACFDGHKEIFCLGYDLQDDTTFNNKITHDCLKVIECYQGVKFYFVNTKVQCPRSWQEQPNVEIIDYRTFISYCDI
jgi:hypothetical protein